MSQFISSVMGITTGAFAWAGDPLMAFLVGMCLVVWIAITSAAVPTWANARKGTSTIAVRPE